MTGLQSNETDSYRELSVYAPDIETPGDAGKRVFVVIHGFMGAMPNDAFRALRKDMAASGTCIGINLAPLDARASWSFLEEVAERYLKDRTVSVIGTSLGGFWARYFGERIGAEHIVMINPVTDPVQQLGQYTGQHMLNEHRQKTYHVTTEALATYRGMTLNTDTVLSTLILLGGQDDIIDPATTRQVFADASGVRFVDYPDEGHSIDLNGHPALDRIAKFLQSGSDMKEDGGRTGDM